MKTNNVKDLQKSWRKILDKSPTKVYSPTVMTFELSEKQKKQFKVWESKLPKKLKKIDYDQWYMFCGKSGIGWTVKIMREYKNGDIREIDVTDVSEW